MKRLRLFLSLLVLSLGTSGCGSDQTSPEEPAAPRLPQNLDCRGKEPTPLDTKVSFTVTLINLTDGAPALGLTVKVCGKIDPGCQNPSASATTDAEGKVTLEAVPALLGYLRVEGSLGTAPIKPVHWYTTRTLDASLSPVLEVAPAVGLDALIQSVSGSYDPMRGYLLFEVKDCAGVPASGIQVSASSADASSKTYYFDQASFSSELTGTTALGRGTIFSLPSGVARLEFRTATEALPLHDGIDVLVVADTLTFVNARPR